MKKRIYLGTLAFILLTITAPYCVQASTNIAPLANATCSSENTSTQQTCDKAIDGVIDGWPGDYTKEWATLGEGAGAWIELDWGTTAYTVDQVLLYDRRNGSDHVLSGTLEFSDGSIISVGSLPNDGTTPFSVTLSTPVTATWVRFTIDTVSSNTYNIGLGEMEVFGNSSGSNSPPIANDDSAFTDEDTPVVIDVLSNDTDADIGDILSVASATQGANGSVSINTDNTVTYTPDLGFSGTDTFTYIAQDDHGAASNEANVTVTVGSINIAPLSTSTCSTENTSTQQTCDKAIDGVIDGWPGDYTKEWATLGEGAGAWIKLDWGSTAYTVDNVYLYDRRNSSDQVLSGTLEFSDGTIIGVGSLPNDGITPLQVSLSTPVTATWAKFTIDSVSSNTHNVGLGEMEVFGHTSSSISSPLAVDDNAVTDQNLAVVVDVLNNDIDWDGTLIPSSVIVNSGPSHGNTSLDSVTGEITYTPDTDFSGLDTFIYTVEDNDGLQSNKATVSVAVGNSPPIADDDSISTYADTAVTIDVLFNDRDLNVGDILSISSVTQGTNGTVNINSNNTLTYTPDSGFIGMDSLNYTISDGNGGSDSGMVTVTVLSNSNNNIALLSTAICSSENTSTQQTCDKGIDGVIDGWPGDYTKEWATLGEGASAWIQLDWIFPHTIGNVTLYDRPNGSDQILSGTLSFSDGSTVSVGSLPNDGTALNVNITPKITATWMRFTVNSVSSKTSNIGLSEIEVSGLSLSPFGEYVAAGNSITKGSQDDISSDGIGYEPILENLLAVEKGYPHVVVNEGVSGITSGGGLLLLPDTINTYPEAKAFLIQYGTNDAFLPKPSGLGLSPIDSGYPGTFKDNMQQMIDMIRDAGKAALLAKVPIAIGSRAFLNPMLQEYNQVINELVLENDVNIVPPDFYCFFEQNQDQMADTLHPDGIGYQSMANIWHDALINQYGGCP